MERGSICVMLLLAFALVQCATAAVVTVTWGTGGPLYYMAYGTGSLLPASAGIPFDVADFTTIDSEAFQFQGTPSSDPSSDLELPTNLQNCVTACAESGDVSRHTVALNTQLPNCYCLPWTSPPASTSPELFEFTALPCENLINGEYYVGDSASDSRGNTITGCGNTIIGDNNVIEGQQVYINGAHNTVTGNDVRGAYYFGDFGLGSSDFAKAAGIYEAAPASYDAAFSFVYTIYIAAHNVTVSDSTLLEGSILVSTNNHVITDATSGIELTAGTYTTDVDGIVINTDSTETHRPCMNSVNGTDVSSTDVDGNVIFGCGNVISGNTLGADSHVKITGSHNTVQGNTLQLDEEDLTVAGNDNYVINNTADYMAIGACRIVGRLCRGPYCVERSVLTPVLQDLLLALIMVQTETTSRTTWSAVLLTHLAALARLTSIKAW